MTYTTQKGTTLTVDNNRLTVTIGGSVYSSGEHTAATVADWERTGKIWLSNGIKSVCVLYDDDFRAWERDNWPLVKSWEDLAPAAAIAYRAWQYALADERAAREHGDWTVSAGEEPTLDAEATAYIYIDDLTHSDSKAEIGRKYADAVRNGMSLTDAASAAKAEVDAETEKNMWM